MGALKYVEELQKKKQSDVLRFLLRVRCWEVSSPARGTFFVNYADEMTLSVAPLGVLLYTR